MNRNRESIDWIIVLVLAAFVLALVVWANYCDTEDREWADPHDLVMVEPLGG
jgi:hypothetical protein